MCYVYYVFNVFVIIRSDRTTHSAQGQPKRMGRPTPLCAPIKHIRDLLVLICYQNSQHTQTLANLSLSRITGRHKQPEIDSDLDYPRPIG